MNIEELEAIADEMSEECGDQIDTLYDTVTLQKDTYNGFICRLREVIRLAKNEPPTASQDAEALRNTLREIRNDILDTIQNHRSEDPDSYAHGLLLSIGGACDIALHENKNTNKERKTTMQPITQEDLEMFKERSRTELRSNCDVSRMVGRSFFPDSLYWAQMPYEVGANNGSK